jgi:diketogulonate reductase-like aldo/keto reductase
VTASLGALGTDYVDLVLLHFPQCFPGVCSEEESARSMRAGGWRASWAALQELQKQGAILACGVSNFDLVNDLDTVRPRPLVVQGWSDALHQDRNLRLWAQRHGVAYVAMSPLGGPADGSGPRQRGRNPVFQR